jgi:group II intron reverse transcriptase/maturase
MKIEAKNLDKQNQRAIPISLEMVRNAYRRVKRKGKSAGIDGVSLKEFQAREEDHLYVVYNRMSSGSYFPPEVKQVSIPKRSGKKRKLGIPTVRDRVAQTVIKELIESRIDRIFYEESYGYRPNKSAHQALDKVRKNCWEKAWVIDLDIKNCFDSIDHQLLMKAVDKHVEEKWIKMYIKRWLEAPVATEKEIIEKEGKGTPQGSVLSPLLANLFLHYAFDRWMKDNFPKVSFVRYADDIIVHCVSKKQAEYVLQRIRQRLTDCKLELNEEKTSIVYCKMNGRNGNYPNVKFDFLGYSFKPRTTLNWKKNKKFLGFDAGISTESQKRIIKDLKEKEERMKFCNNLQEVAEVLNPSIRGWLNYYGHIRRSEMIKVLVAIQYRITKWLRKKYGRLKKRIKKTFSLLWKVKRVNPKLFAHWS